MYETILRLANPRWRGPLMVFAGLTLLAIQLLLIRRLLHSWLIGAGVGLILVGGVAWFFYLDDRNHGKRDDMNRDDELPSADEYDRLLDGMDQEVD